MQEHEQDGEIEWSIPGGVLLYLSQETNLSQPPPTHPTEAHTIYVWALGRAAAWRQRRMCDVVRAG